MKCTILKELISSNKESATIIIEETQKEATLNVASCRLTNAVWLRFANDAYLMELLKLGN